MPVEVLLPQGEEISASVAREPILWNPVVLSIPHVSRLNYLFSYAPGWRNLNLL
jgi:hypothetical protein